MSDTSSTALDPKRPWLTDERELPGHMNWLQTLFNPTGESPRLHFTRAWTLLFILQLMVIAVPFAIALVLNAAGGDGKPVGTFGVYATPVVFVVTTLISYVIHARRLRDAGKSSLLAIIPLIPLVIAVIAFTVVTVGAAAQYDAKFEMRQEYLADPDAFRAKQREEQQKAKEATETAAAEKAESEEAASAEAGEGETAQQQPEAQQRRRGPGGPSGPGAGLDQPLGAKAPTVLKSSLPTIQMIIIFLSTFIAIWSLMWVARAPFFGNYPSGNARSRGDADLDVRRGYEA